jgi:hypothetical protein
MAGAPSSIGQHELLELTFRARDGVADPFQVEWSVRFLHEGGRELVVPGFYDGGDVFRARCAPPELGRWRYALAAPAGLALDGPTEGEVDCIGSETAGPLTVAPEPHHFVHANGRRAFVLGTTAYNLVAAYLRAPDEARELVRHYADRHFNWFRFFLEQVTWDSHGVVVWPWAGTPAAPEWSAYSLETFRAAEAVIHLLAEHGCTASVILLHPSDAVFHGRDDLVPLLRRYVRYAVARLSGYQNVVWNIANEWERQFVLTGADVDALGSYLDQVDPHARLTSVHHYARFEFPDRSWVDMASIQHRGLPHDVNRVVVVNRAFGKPVLNEEYGYEADTINPPNDPANVRRDHWALTMAGAYGTHGDKTKGSKIGVYFSSTLKDSVGAVVQDALQHIPTLMARTRYWEMTPLNDLLSGCIPQEVFCLARPGQEYVVYMTVGQDVGIDLSHVDAPRLAYEWWNPRSGEVGPPLERPRHEGERPWGSATLRRPVVFTPPDYENDWVLHLSAVPSTAGAD